MSTFEISMSSKRNVVTVLHKMRSKIKFCFYFFSSILSKFEEIYKNLGLILDTDIFLYQLSMNCLENVKKKKNKKSIFSGNWRFSKICSITQD